MNGSWGWTVKWKLNRGGNGFQQRGFRPPNPPSGAATGADALISGTDIICYFWLITSSACG